MGQMAIKKLKKKTKVTFGNIGRGALRRMGRGHRRNICTAMKQENNAGRKRDFIQVKRLEQEQTETSF